MKRNICVVTSSRADYGLLRGLMQEIKHHPNLNLQLIVTGMHLSETFGLTYKEIEEDGFELNSKVETLSDSDAPVEIAESVARGISGCARSFEELQPDIIVLLGDRFEIFAAATAAYFAKIPIAHLHGGETTIGALDEALRHSITKMSSLHFVATEEYKKRVIQLGENPKFVFNVGGIGTENVGNTKILGVTELEEALGFKLGDKNLLVTFHPATLDSQNPVNQLDQLLDALSELSDTKIIFTLPNADTGGREFIKRIEEFVSMNSNSRSYVALGQLLYFSCVSHTDGVVGNSSSGLLEVPSFKKGTINIGDRQKGRIQSSSVINCHPFKFDILMAIEKLYSTDFQESLKSSENPYAGKDTVRTIVQKLNQSPLNGIAKKQFYDL